MNKLSIKAPAKLNLHLQVLGERSDGYHDISSYFSFINLFDVLEFYLIKDEIAEDIISSYKRASSILESELKNSDLELSNTTDPGIFKNDYEKNLFKKINEIRKYFTNIGKDENYKETLEILAGAKKVISEFFDNVKVNDDDKNIKKNRLELLQMLCRTFDNYINFSNIEIK